MARVLEGLRVIDFGQYIAGPLAGMLLADQGADVIRVDPPGGPWYDTPANAVWNRGKRSIVLDLKTEEGRATAQRLIASADIVIENFRPGVMERLGLGAQAMTATHPQLIYCSLPGFASDDPRAAMPGWEGVILAATGAYLLKTQALKIDGGRRRSRDAEQDATPVYTITPVASVYAGFWAAAAIAMALIARQRDGLGQHIEVPLFDATFTAIGSPKWAGIPGSPWVREYECADGRWIDMTGYHGKFNRAFLKEAGVEHWANEAFVGNLDRPYKTEAAQATEAIRRLEALFRTRTALEWESALNAAGVPCAICRTSEEWLALPETRAAEAVVELPDRKYGPMIQPGVQVRMSATPGGVTTPAPLPDEHRARILAELDAFDGLPRRPSLTASLPTSLPTASPTAADALNTPTQNTQPPLAGLRVIDLGTVLVGPACGRTLAEFGADVIKIDDPRGLGPGVDVSRGKRSILLNITHPDGKQVLERLADQADVFLQNFRLGVAERDGYGYDQLRARNPGVVYISFTLHGRTGPWAARPGYEYQAQAATGMQIRFGGGQPYIESFAVNDYGTSLMGTYAVALALYHRAELRSKGLPATGQHVDTALTYTAAMLQSPILYQYAGKVWDEPRGQHVLGSGALHRNYRARDGWFFLGANDKDDTNIRVLDAVAGLQGFAAVAPERRALFLEQCFAEDTVEQWVTRLRAAGLGAHQTQTVPEVMVEPWVLARGLHLQRPHPDGGTVSTIGPIPRFSRTPLVPGRPLRPSMDAGEILAEAQREGDLERLIAEGVVRIRPPAPAD